MTRWDKVKSMAAALKGDGCTASPDLAYTRCCDEHDIHYRTGKTINGKPITRAQSDAQLRECMKRAGKTPVVGRWLLPWVYWSAVRLFGRQAWNPSPASSGGKLSDTSPPPPPSMAASAPISGTITKESPARNSPPITRTNVSTDC